MNPIEEAFGCAKRWLQRNTDVCVKYRKWCFETALAHVSYDIIILADMVPL